MFDPAETNPQGSRQDIAQKEFVTEAYCDVTRGVHGPRLSATKSNLMGQCLTQPKLTLKEAGRIFLREKLSQRPNLILQGTWPRTFSHKVKPDGSVFDTAKTNPQGSRQDFAWTDFVTEPYRNVTIGVHGSQVSAVKSNLMGQCSTQPKLTLKEAGRIFSETEFVTEAYRDVTRCVHGPRVSAVKLNLMGQCLTQLKLTLKKAGRIFPGRNHQKDLP